MKDTTIDKLAFAFFIVCGVVGIALIGLFGWAIIELVQWITSK